MIILIIWSPYAIPAAWCTWFCGVWVFYVAFCRRSSSSAPPRNSQWKPGYGLGPMAYAWAWRNRHNQTEPGHLESVFWALESDYPNLGHSNWEAPEAKLLAPMHAILMAYPRKAPRAQSFGPYPNRICALWSSEFRAPFYGIRP